MQQIKDLLTELKQSFSVAKLNKFSLVSIAELMEAELMEAELMEAELMEAELMEAELMECSD